VVWTSARVEHWQRTGIRPAVAGWTPAQTVAFLNSIRGHRLCAAYRLIALRGFRRRGLQWSTVASVPFTQPAKRRPAVGG